MPKHELDLSSALGFKAARKYLGLSCAELAECLKMGPNGERTIRRYEAGDLQPTGPVQVALSLMLDFS